MGNVQIRRYFIFYLGILVGGSLVSLVIGTVSFAAITQIGCPSLKFYGIDPEGPESVAFNNRICKIDQGCSSDEYEPVCSIDGKTHFFSPCQAGCKSCEIKLHGQKEEKKIKLYSKCSCVTAHSNETNTSVADPWPKNAWPEIATLPGPVNVLKAGEVVNNAFSGYCPSKCQKQFFYILGIMILTGFVFTANRLPALLVFMRAVDPRDKTTAFTFIVSFISLFALIPGPIIYGAIFDSACILWGTKCGETQHCLVYDTKSLRIRTGSLSVIFFLISLCCEIGIFYYAKNLNIYDDKAGQGSQMEEEEGTITTTTDKASSNSISMDQIPCTEEQNKHKT